MEEWDFVEKCTLPEDCSLFVTPEICSALYELSPYLQAEISGYS